jgi:hypothetical protein
MLSVKVGLVFIGVLIMILVWHFQGNEAQAKSHAGEALNLLHKLKSYKQVPSLWSPIYTLQDGSKIYITSIYDTDTIRINSPYISEEVKKMPTEIERIFIGGLFGVSTYSEYIAEITPLGVFKWEANPPDTEAYVCEGIRYQNNYVYCVGYYVGDLDPETGTTAHYQVEKREITSGDRVEQTDLSPFQPFYITSDNTGVYIGGQRYKDSGNRTEWVIQKRSLKDLSLLWETNGGTAAINYCVYSLSLNGGTLYAVNQHYYVSGTPLYESWVYAVNTSTGEYETLATYPPAATTGTKPNSVTNRGNKVFISATNKIIRIGTDGWEVTLPSNTYAYKITSDSSGVYVLVQLWPTTTWYINKYSFTGELKWQTPFTLYSALGIKAGSTGVYLVGYTAAPNYIHTQKFNVDGDSVWSNDYPGPTATGQTIDVFVGEEEE